MENISLVQQKREELQKQIDALNYIEKNPEFLEQFINEKAAKRVDIPSEIKIVSNTYQVIKNSSQKKIEMFMSIPDKDMNNTQLFYKILYENPKVSFTNSLMEEHFNKKKRPMKFNTVSAIFSARFNKSKNQGGLLLLNSNKPFLYKLKDNYVFDGNQKKINNLSEKGFDLIGGLKVYIKDVVKLNDTFTIDKIKKNVAPSDKINEINDSEIVQFLSVYCNTHLRLIEKNPSVYIKHTEFKN